jgi:hypothetical protein
MDYVLLFMDYVLREDRGQAALLPSALEGYGPVRVIDAFVDGLDVGGLGFGRAAPAGTGRPPYERLRPRSRGNHDSRIRGRSRRSGWRSASSQNRNSSKVY